jgi:hypothetical protein
VTGRTRATVLAALIGIAGTGCAAPSAPPPPPSVPPGLTTPEQVERWTDPTIPPELRVRTPKDARGIAPCDLLTRDQLLMLGLSPDTARPISFGLAEGCVWRHADDSTAASAGLSLDPDAQKLPDLYRIRGAFQTFEILEVAGHPAVRADARPVGQCDLNVAVADLQILTLQGYLDARVLPDPCAPARRMAEMVLANLPPLR